MLRRLKGLEVRTRGFVESLFSGDYPSVFHGRGLELSHLRIYEPGDDVRAIDWKVTARRSTPYVRQFIEERDLLLVLVIDISASGRLGPGDRSAGEVAAEIAAALCFAATRNNDRIALILVSDRVEMFLEPRSGRNHALRVLTEVMTHVPSNRGTDLTTALEQVTRSFPRRGTVVLVSDFVMDTANDRFRAAIGAVARNHETIAVRLDTASGAHLPDVGWLEIRDPESGRRVVVNSGSRRVRESYRHRVRLAEAELAQQLASLNVELVDVGGEEDALQVLSGFFRRRRRAAR
jgi:uncharacterized protein (DUF58 family)